VAETDLFKWRHFSFHTARRTIGGYEVMNMTGRDKLKESGKATFADKLDSWLISSMSPPELK
jgi:hypothetical protein